MSIRATLATSAVAWEASVALHTEVYCDQEKFEDRKNHTDPKVFDQLDYNQTDRALVWRNNDLLGTVRVIKKGTFLLPAMKEMGLGQQNNDTVEMSAFCSSCSKGMGASERMLITNHLIGCSIAMSYNHMIEHELDDIRMVTLMTPALTTLLWRRFGIKFNKVAGPFSHFGERNVYQALLLQEILPSMLHEKPDAWRIATNGGALYRFFSNNHKVLEKVA